MRALIVEHERATPGGYVSRWLADRQAEIEILQIDLVKDVPDPRDYELIVPLGSEYAAYDDSLPWIEREKRFLLDAVDAEVPVLGVCFGAQLLARLLGGDVWRSERSEIGWLPVHTKEPELVPAGPWFQWHFDTFSLPPGASLIADSSVGPQAYTVGRSLGVQFHPEVTVEIMDDWVRVYRHELDADGVDPDALLEETRRREDESCAAAYQLFDAFADRIARLEKVRGR